MHRWKNRKLLIIFSQQRLLKYQNFFHIKKSKNNIFSLLTLVYWSFTSGFRSHGLFSLFIIFYSCQQNRKVNFQALLSEKWWSVAKLKKWRNILLLMTFEIEKICPKPTLIHLLRSITKNSKIAKFLEKKLDTSLVAHLKFSCPFWVIIDIFHF